MKNQPIKRKEFLAGLGKIGLGTCFCAAAAGMQAAFGGISAPSLSDQTTAAPKVPDQTKPGEKTVERAAKRMEFGDVWVKRFFGVMDRTLDESSRSKLMMANGKACYTDYAGPSKRKPGPDAFEKFKEWVVREGKKQGYSIEGDVITSEFTSSAETGQAAPANICLCPMAETQTAGSISPTYCLCSLGYVKEMHERILGRTVNVELVDSVLRGGRSCKFKMTVV